MILLKNFDKVLNFDKVKRSLPLNDLPDRNLRRFQLRGIQIPELLQRKSRGFFRPLFQRMVFQTRIIFRQLHAQQFFRRAIQIKAQLIKMFRFNAFRRAIQVIIGSAFRNSHPHQSGHGRFQALLQKTFSNL